MIRGIGDKVRAIFIYDGAFSALADWLTKRDNNPDLGFVRLAKET
jgi:hypothetical protein